MRGARRSAVLLAAGLLLSSTLASPSAKAASSEAARLTYAAPPGCATEAEFVAQIAGFDARLRAPEGPGNVRMFDVRISAHEGLPLLGQLRIRDVWDEETLREVAGEQCEEVARSLALFVALALEDPTEPARRPRRRAPPPELPEPKEEKSLGAAGLTTSAHIDWNGSHFQKGVRISAAAPALGATHFGGVLAVTGDIVDSYQDGSFIGTGYSGRLGGLISWGAPFNEKSVAGFVGEIGAVAGHQQGLLEKNCEGPACANHIGPNSSTYLSAYAAASLVLQVPWKAPVRPFAGTTMILLTLPDGLDVLFGFDAGMAW